MNSHQVPFFSLHNQTHRLSEELAHAIQSVINKQQFVGGPHVELFEERLAKKVGINHAIGVNSGTDALWLSLKALDIQPNDIVLTTPFSFIASSSEIAAHKAHPVFIDIDSESYNINAMLIAQWLEQHAEIKNGMSFHKETGQKISGIITVDIFGQLAAYEQIKKIARTWNLWIIEDSCQAINAYATVQTDSEKQEKKYCGSFGDIGTFSFYPTKNLGAFGDAGACVTDNPQLASRLKRLRNHGRASHYHYEELGINSRIDGLQAAILTVKLSHLDSWTQRRQEIAHYYNEQFKEITALTTPVTLYGEHVYHQYSLQVAKNSNQDKSLRDELIAYLHENGVGSRIFYPETLASIPFLCTDKRLVTTIEKAEQATQTILSLPIWPELTDVQVEYVAEIIRSAPMLQQVPPHNFYQSKAA